MMSRNFFFLIFLAFIYKEAFIPIFFIFFVKSLSLDYNNLQSYVLPKLLAYSCVNHTVNNMDLIQLQYMPRKLNIEPYDNFL